MRLPEPHQKETLLTGLSDFWQRLFADSGQLEHLYAGTEVLLGQAYLDLLHDVLTVSLQDTPLFRKEYWQLIQLREDRTRRNPATGNYEVALPEQVVDLRYLFNRIYSPTVSLEVGVDFSVDVGRLVFSENPFAGALAGIPVREVSIVPSTYNHGEDGVVIAAEPKRLRVLQVLTAGAGRVEQGTRLYAPAGSFTPDMVGQVLRFSAGPGQAVHVRAITSVVRNDFLYFDGPAIADIATLQWRVSVVNAFASSDVGDRIALTDSATQREEIYTIIEVSGDGLTVTLDRDAHVTPGTSLHWRHQSAARVREVAFWAPNVMIDREDLYFSFGYLINRREASTEEYRARLQSVFQYFMAGPAVARIEGCLNILIGVPVVREDGEVVRILRQTESNDVVETDRHVYLLPRGSAKPLVAGDSLRAFEALTTLFAVHDYVDNPTWFYGRFLPDTIVQGYTLPDLTINARAFEQRIGYANPWYMGAPATYVGADYNGELIPRYSGRGAFPVPGAPHQVYFLDETQLEEEDVGASLLLQNTNYAVAAAFAYSGEYPACILSETADHLFPEDTLVVDALSPTQVTFASTRLSQERDTGRDLYVSWGAGSAIGHWTITQVLTPTQAIITPHISEPALSADVGIALFCVLGEDWTCYPRPPLVHNIGYGVMQTYLRRHLAMVELNLKDAKLPFPRAERDLEAILLAGKPAHTSILFSSSSSLQAQMGVRDLGATTTFFRNERVRAPTTELRVGTNWSIGEEFIYAQSGIARWTQTLRARDAATPTELLGAAAAAGLYFQFIGSGTATESTLTLEYFDGTDWLAQAPIVLTPTLPYATSAPTGQRARASYVVDPPGAQAVIRVGLTALSPSYLGFSRTGPAFAGVAVLDGYSLIAADFAFYEFDRFSEIYLHGKRYLIWFLLSETEVALYDPQTKALADFAIEAGVDWRLGVSRLATTALAVGGAVKYVPEGQGSSFFAYPCEVLFVADAAEPPEYPYAFDLDAFPTGMPLFDTDILGGY